MKDYEIKKIQDVFDEVKDEPKMIESDGFCIHKTDIFDQENQSEKDRNFIMDLIDRTNFIADGKKRSRRKGCRNGNSKL